MSEAFDQPIIHSQLISTLNQKRTELIRIEGVMERILECGSPLRNRQDMIDHVSGIIFQRRNEIVELEQMLIQLTVIL